MWVFDETLIKNPLLIDLVKQRVQVVVLLVVLLVVAKSDEFLGEGFAGFIEFGFGCLKVVGDDVLSLL